MQNCATSRGLEVELPTRANPAANPEWIAQLYGAWGDPIAEVARGHSADEWLADELRAVELANKLGLSDDDFDCLLERLRNRNVLVWREHSIFYAENGIG